MKEIGVLLDQATADLHVKVVKDAEGKIVQGIHLGDVTEQNIKTILKIQPGEMKEQPTVGVGIDNMLLGHDSLLYKHKIRQQLGDDGMTVKYLEIDKKVNIHANYK